MAKGNKQRGNREAKKPKADKKQKPVSGYKANYSAGTKK